MPEGAFLNDELSKHTSIFGLRLWVVVGICVGAGIVLVLFLISLWFTSRRNSAKSSHKPTIPNVSKEIQEIRIDHSRNPANPNPDPKTHHPPNANPLPESDPFAGAERLLQPGEESPVGLQRIHIEIGKDHRISYPERGGGSSHGSGEARSGDQVTIAVPEVSHLGWGHWYTLRELELSTNGFADENVIGEGGYGTPHLMARSFSLLFFLLFSLFFVALTSSELHSGGSDDDIIIRQVVPELGDVEGGEEENLLTADHHHFSIFKRRFGKSYASQEEHDYRFKVFKANLRRARRHQQLDPSATHGVTQFSDLTPAEFRGTYLGLRPLKLPHDAQKAPILPTNDLPEDFDWRDHGAVTAVKNQGSCGSCWSFSTTGALEGANFLATGNLVSLSEQQLVECDHECDPEEMGSCDSGCNGGLMNTAFEYTLKAGGLMKEEDYPYTGTDRGSCKFDKTKIAASVSNFSVISLDEDQIAANLVKNGPLAVAINAVFMQTYVGGVSCPYICSKRLDHGVLLVGYGSAGYAPIRMKDKPYWIIKNSWGENWGENGFYKICRGRNVCGVDSMVSTVAAVHTTSN